MGTIRNITPKSESKFSLKKKLSIAAALAAIAAATYFFYTPTGHRSVYGNKVSEYITTEAGRKAEVAWLVKKGFNAYVGYGVREYLVSNPAWVQDFVLKCRRAGIRDVGFVYGSEMDSDTIFLNSPDFFTSNVLLSKAVICFCDG